MHYAGPDAGPIEVGGIRNGQKVSYFVSDHGKGICTEEQQQIFTAFYRRSTGKGKTGSGVGLATVQKNCKLNGGHATISETLGGGATLRVEMQDANESKKKAQVAQTSS